MLNFIKWLTRPTFDVVMGENAKLREIVKEKNLAIERMASKLDDAERKLRMQTNATKWLIVEARKYKAGEKAVSRYENIIEGML